MLYRIIYSERDLSSYEWRIIAYVIHELKEYYCSSIKKDFFLRFCTVEFSAIENRRYVTLWGLKINNKGFYEKDRNKMLFHMELNKTIQYINRITPLTDVLQNFKIDEYETDTRFGV